MQIRRQPYFPSIGRNSPHRVADDFRWETVASVGDSAVIVGVIHARILVAAAIPGLS